MLCVMSLHILILMRAGTCPCVCQPACPYAQACPPPLTSPYLVASQALECRKLEQQEEKMQLALRAVATDSGRERLVSE
jgi:hypothetical protein